MKTGSKQLPLDWVNISFLLGTPLLAAVLVPFHIVQYGWSLGLFLLFLVYYVMIGLSITGGYHRLFSHRSYEARPWVRFLFLFFGAGAFQNSALNWCMDHRRHHRFVDTDNDPYNIKRGFLYAHMGWIFFKPNPETRSALPLDLTKDPLVMWQHKYYLPLCLIAGFLVPTLVGWGLFGDALGGFVWGGILRTVVAHHCTFLVNSLCHTWGGQSYSDKTSARDNAITALFTYGEGYHNYHHEFQADYRNGIRWYHWDPTKWTIKLMSWVGGAYRLKKTAPEIILQARLNMDSKRLSRKVPTAITMSESLKLRVETAQLRLKSLKAEYQIAKKEFKDTSYSRYLQLKAEMKIAKLEFKTAYAQWRVFIKTVSAA